MYQLRKSALVKNQQGRSQDNSKGSVAKAFHRFAEAANQTGLSAEKLHRDALIIERLAELFSDPDPPYALNGGAALNMIFLDGIRRVPSDIDLRCDDLEECQRMLSERFQPVSKPAPVEMHSFVDEKGVVIDLAQNHFPRTKKRFQARSILCDHGLAQYVADVLRE